MGKSYSSIHHLLVEMGRVESGSDNAKFVLALGFHCGGHMLILLQ